MMPLAPHISLPAIGHMTATTASTASDLSSNMSSKPKLAFSIDSIVGRKNSSAIDCHSDSDRVSPRVLAQHKSRHSPVNCGRSRSPQMMIHRMSECSPQMGRQLSPSNRSAANMSPMSTPSPISMANGSASSPYLDPTRVNPLIGQQTHNQSPIGQTGPHIQHPMMMAAAHHMSPIPQPYHQAMALYPWLFRANPFANRFHGMPFDGGLSSFLLPPFRKPKRIRTAFSPGQLLKLEQAFEKNHYVVGAERKQLASDLGLSETQVKVWFQNRRTKHKRQKQEDDELGTDGQPISDKHKNSSDRSGADSDVDDEEEEEDIDMEDNGESDSNTNEELMKHHQLWYQALQSGHHSPPVSLPTTHGLSSASSSTTKI